MAENMNGASGVASENRHWSLDSPNKLKLGAFAFNGDFNRNTAPERFTFNWENSLDVARQADRMGLEMIVPATTFSSAGGPTHPSAYSFENLTWTAAVAAQTKSSAVLSTVNVKFVHPVMAAKAMATIDHISNGRFGLNLITGWSPVEVEMFGGAFVGPDDRYGYADEWLTVIKRLWTEDEYVNFEGKYFQIRNGLCQPKPIQRPWPLLMNAGQSADGRQFAVKHCDIAFITALDREYLAQNVTSYRREAKEKFGRDIQVWGQCVVIMGDTPEAAQAMYETIGDHVDDAYVSAHMSTVIKPYVARLGRDLTPEEAVAMKRRLAAGNGALLIGTPRQIVEELAFISSCGVDGMLLVWNEFQSGIRKFEAEVMPMLREAGLRE